MSCIVHLVGVHSSTPKWCTCREFDYAACCGSVVTSPQFLAEVADAVLGLGLGLGLIGGVLGALLYHLAADIVALFASWFRRRYGGPAD